MGELVLQKVGIESCVDKCPEGHIAADTGKAVKVRNFQGNIFFNKCAELPFRISDANTHVVLSQRKIAHFY